MKWFQIKEQAAGEKRLILSWHLYKIFGKNILYVIAYLVSFFTFVFSKKIRTYSKKYFRITQPYTNIKPTLKNQFMHIHSYAKTLVDKIFVYSGDFNAEDLIFEREEDKEQLFSDIKQNKGIFFICTHIGNVEVMQSFFLNKNTRVNNDINIFMSHKQSQIFNNFLKKIQIPFPVKLYPVEDIGLNTGIELKENLDKGGIVFIAGDRVSENNDTKSIETELFGHKILLPKGTFKLAELMDVQTYFVSAVKTGSKYKIYYEKQNNLNNKNLVKQYTQFLEKMVQISPFQFFHFYDFFN